MDYSRQYSSTIEKYDIIEKKWTSCKDLTVSRSRLATVAYDGKIYAIGGLEGTNDNDCKNSTAVEQYDPKKDSWTRKADMPTPKHGHSAVVIKNKILVVGGYTDTGPTGIVEEYDTDTDKWKTKSKMPTPRGFFGLVTIDNYAYAIAGRVRQDKGPIERYDFENDLWTQLDPMPGWRNRFGIAQLDNKVYIIGGDNNPKSTLIGELKNK